MTANALSVAFLLYTLLTIKFVMNPNFERESGMPFVKAYPKKASTVINAGNALVADSNGYVEPAGDATRIVGIAAISVRASDPDYADNTMIEVQVPKQGDTFVAQVGTGTATQGSVGDRCDLDSDGKVDLTGSTNNLLEVVSFRTASEVVVKFVDM